ncbi:hypothetical protein QA601_18150 [Chitinispirillales bacterium ANBcel5]|uniref:hypothetical protein n=1 Tax=Cellulosispirillum alkaliphilum TaxID=3039283 RepID=UPI002A5421D4|nr:hypothetical protein [Chitinispirillales bacterium ANBcel5]
MAIKQKIIFIFLDGFGLGKKTPLNPIYTFKLFTELLDEPLVDGIDIRSNDTVVKGIDACLDVDGIPQSATGQIALFCGVNGAKLLGYHRPAFPCKLLRQQIDQGNIFLNTVNSGKSATFANAYRNEYFERVKSGDGKKSVTTLCCLSAGVTLRGIDQYNNSEAVLWDITGSYTQRTVDYPINGISPQKAGDIIGALSQKHDLVVYESFLPDFLGHSCDINQAETLCSTLNCFIESLLKNLDGNTTVLITSDHGNFEDLSTRSHTKNPVPLFARGAAADPFYSAESIIDVPKIMLDILLK